MTTSSTDPQGAFPTNPSRAYEAELLLAYLGITPSSNPNSENFLISQMQHENSTYGNNPLASSNPYNPNDTIGQGPLANQTFGSIEAQFGLSGASSGSGVQSYNNALTGILETARNMTAPYYQGALYGLQNNAQAYYYSQGTAVNSLDEWGGGSNYANAVSSIDMTQQSGTAGINSNVPGNNQPVNNGGMSSGGRGSATSTTGNNGNGSGSGSSSGVVSPQQGLFDMASFGVLLILAVIIGVVIMGLGMFGVIPKGAKETAATVATHGAV